MNTDNLPVPPPNTDDGWYDAAKHASDPAGEQVARLATDVAALWDRLDTYRKLQEGQQAELLSVAKLLDEVEPAMREAANVHAIASARVSVEKIKTWRRCAVAVEAPNDEVARLRGEVAAHAASIETMTRVIKAQERSIAELGTALRESGDINVIDAAKYDKRIAELEKELQELRARPVLNVIDTEGSIIAGAMTILETEEKSAPAPTKRKK